MVVTGASHSQLSPPQNELWQLGLRVHRIALPRSRRPTETRHPRGLGQLDLHIRRSVAALARVATAFAFLVGFGAPAALAQNPYTWNNGTTQSLHRQLERRRQLARRREQPGRAAQFRDHPVGVRRHRRLHLVERQSAPSSSTG